VTKKKRKLDGVLFFIGFIAFVLLSLLTIVQQFEIWELAKQQTVILVIVDEKLTPISEQTDIVADRLNRLFGGEVRVQPGGEHGTKFGNPVTGN